MPDDIIARSLYERLAQMLNDFGARTNEDGDRIYLDDDSPYSIEEVTAGDPVDGPRPSTWVVRGSQGG